MSLRASPLDLDQSQNNGIPPSAVTLYLLGPDGTPLPVLYSSLPSTVNNGALVMGATANYVWNYTALDWEKMSQPGGGGGGSGPVQLQDGAGNPISSLNGALNVNTNTNQTFRLDESGAPNTLYIGYAPAGSSESAGVWQITQINISGTGVKMVYPGGLATYVNQWSNRTGYTYS